ncbi:MAG: NAD-dependent epimerase/dehydratase family protein [Coxiellaceae bacterium]|nr:MAG: NAD-dependent epimerase/dehydratase family protein [Coxiellaceae bacterium]
MRIFITGATGYIGFAVATAFAAKGHEVFGLVRSEEKAKKVAATEVKPVIGNMNDPESYIEIASSCQLLIHCASEMSAQFHALDQKTIETLIKIANASNLQRSIIYTSGTWLYGNTGNNLANESSKLNPPAFIKPRQEVENKILQSTNSRLSTLIIRPGCVYGGAGGLTASWFESANKKGKATIVGDGNFHWAMIHIQDLADLYVRAGESYLTGQIFNATDHSRSTIFECAKSASRIAGKSEAVQTISISEATKTLGTMAECLTLDQQVDSGKAIQLLGWRPRHNGFVDGIERYFIAWKSLQPNAK